MGSAANKWREMWCTALHNSVQLLPDRSMRHPAARPDCSPSPEQMIIIPYVPNVASTTAPSTMRSSALPDLAQRSLLVYSHSRCAETEADNAGKKLRCEIAVTHLAWCLCMRPSPKGHSQPPAGRLFTTLSTPPAEPLPWM